MRPTFPQLVGSSMITSASDPTTSSFFVPLCWVEAVEPAGKPSARMGWVGDQTGLLMMGGVQFVPEDRMRTGSVLLDPADVQGRVLKST